MAGVAVVTSGWCRGSGKKIRREEEKQCQISLTALLTSAFRKSLAQCHLREEERAIDIGWPSEVHHITHVTFDRFHGFLGLPMEFELQIPRQSPSASVNVFGISPESMQCGYDSNGNSVPIVLLLMQERLYSQGGLEAEGIFRINPENGKEKEVREQLSKGILPDDIDVHCLASLIKAWFRELPEGLMDSLSPGQVLLCESEEDYVELVKLLPPIQYALFNWAIELMVDVVEEEESNKMNVRNIVMVFAPNMTQLSDPLTSLMHAVQVMNLLKTLVLKALREREEHVTEIFWPSTCSRSSHGYARGDLFEEDMSDGLSYYEDEHSSNYYEDKDVEESCNSRRDSRCDFSITEELVKGIEECFLNQLQWKEEKIDSSSDQELEDQFSFSPLSERSPDCFVRSEELSFRKLLVKDAVKLIEGYDEINGEMNQESMERTGIQVGTIVGDVVKMIEERKKAELENSPLTLHNYTDLPFIF